MSRVIAICGKPCSGKTVYAQRLCTEQNAVLLSVDEIMLAVFGQNVGEKHDFYVQQVQKYLLKKSLEIIRTGAPVILDWGFWTKQNRSSTKAFYEKQDVAYELHYIAVSDSVRKSYMDKRNSESQTNQDEAYFIDEGLLLKADSLFDAPDASEITLLVKV